MNPLTIVLPERIKLSQSTEHRPAFLGHDKRKCCVHAKVLKERRACLICTVLIVVLTMLHFVDILVVATAGKSILIMAFLQRNAESQLVSDDEKG